MYMAIFAKANTSTEINAGVWIPDTANVWQEVTAFSSTANFNATGIGFGVTPTMGVGGGWLALDMNVTWHRLVHLINLYLHLFSDLVWENI